MAREHGHHEPEHDYDELLEPSHAGAIQRHTGHAMEHGGHHGGHHAPPHGGHHPAHGGHAGHHPSAHGGPPVEVHHHHHPPQPPPFIEEERRGRRKSTTRERNERNREDGSPDRLFPIGFYELGVPANSEADIVVQPQVEFQGKRLAIPLEIARNFDVIDIKVGKDSQLAATGVLAGSCFGTTAVDVWMELDWAEPGIVITLRVMNNTGSPQDFKAVMYGRVRDN